MVETANSSRKHDVVNERDAKELPANWKAVIKNKPRLNENAGTAEIFERKTFHDSPKAVLNEV